MFFFVGYTLQSVHFKYGLRHCKGKGNAGIRTSGTGPKQCGRSISSDCHADIGKEGE